MVLLLLWISVTRPRLHFGSPFRTDSGRRTTYGVFLSMDYPMKSLSGIDGVVDYHALKSQR